jgi:hypothetical protein
MNGMTRHVTANFPAARQVNQLLARRTVFAEACFGPKGAEQAHEQDVAHPIS